MTKSVAVLLLSGAHCASAARLNFEATINAPVAYKCDTIPTFAADPLRACGSIPGKAACFSLTPDTFWSCAGSTRGPTFVQNNRCDHIRDPNGHNYDGVCVHEGHAQYGSSLAWDGGAARDAAAVIAAREAAAEASHAAKSDTAGAASCRRRRCMTPSPPAPPAPSSSSHQEDRRRRAPHPETSRMAPGWVPMGRDGRGVPADAIGWETQPNTSFGTGLWCESGAPAVGWSPGSDSCPEKVGEPLQVKILTYNLFWWNLFGVRHGNGHSAGHLIDGNGPFDFMGFQECPDVQHVLNEANLHDFTGYNPAQAIAVAWNRREWRELGKGYVDVAEDSHLQWYGVRSAVWARLQHRSTGKVALLVNHHGPLPTHRPGGICGPEATAYNILRVIGEHALHGDAVFLLGDFNAYGDSETFVQLQRYLTLAYRGHTFRGVDEFFTNCGQVLDAENLGTGGSDHEALKVTFAVY